MNDTRTLVKRTEKKARKVYRKHPREVRVIAVFLVFAMAFSAFGANLNSIVKLLEAYAEDDYADSGNMFYPADLTLYDYYTDSELTGGSDNNAYDGVNRNKIFNMALYESGYATGQKTDNKNSDDWYWPLYLGLQFPGQGDSNPMIRAGGNPYNYSIMVNSQADTGNTSYAAQGLVDNVLYAGEIAQGNGTTLLPYFDEEFLEAKLSRLMNTATLASEGVTNTTQSLGKVEKDMTFRFRKLTDGYYVYRSATDPLKYDADNKTFTTGTADGGFKQDLSWTGHAAQNAFFPFNVKEEDGYKGKFGYGARFDIPFTMSGNGQTTINGPTQDIKFTFSGDDDVWVFIDGHLVLDVGGAHGRVDGEVNFYTKKATVQKTKVQSAYDMQDGSAVGHVNNNTSSVDHTNLFNNLGLYSDVTREHTLTVFYLERGSLESNCEIKFNFQISDKVIIKNTIEMGDVNEKLEAATQQVIDSEGMQYIAASNSISSTDDNDTDETTNTGTLVTLSYDKGGATGRAPASKKVTSNTQVVLSKGYTLEKSGYRIKGWNTAADQTNPDTSSPYTVSSTRTLYPVWEKIPIAPLASPPVPTLVLGTSDFYLPNFNSETQSWVAHNHTILNNYTGIEMSYNPVYMRIQGKGTQASVGDPGGNEHYHPRDDTPKPVIDGYTEIFDKENNGNPYVKIMKNGGFYVWEVTGTTSSTLTRGDSYASSGYNLNAKGGEYSKAHAWVEKYYQIYEKLKEYYENYKDTTDNDIRIAYNNAVNDYKGKQFSMGQSTGTENLDSLLTNLEQAITNHLENTKTYMYYAGEHSSATDNAVFYVYSTSTPTVVGANSYTCENSGESKTAGDGTEYAQFNNTKSFSGVVGIDAPDGHHEPSGDSDGRRYWKITVPKYAYAVEYDVSNAASDPVRKDNNIKITADGQEKTMTAAQWATMASGNYPCWYAAAGQMKDILADVRGRMIKKKKLWIYSTSRPTVRVTNVLSNGCEDVTATAEGNLANYWYAEVCTESQMVSGGAVTQTEHYTNITVDSVTKKSSEIFTPGNGDSPCYYPANSDAGTIAEWYKMKTVVAQLPTWWGDSNCQIFINKGPLAVNWGTYRPMAKVTGQTNDYYYYLPAWSSNSAEGCYILFKNPTDYGDSYQTEDIYTVESDLYYKNYSNSNDGKYSTSDIENITDAFGNIWQATATYKATVITNTEPVYKAPLRMPDAQDAITVPSSETKTVTLPDASAATVDDTKGGWENFEPSDGADSASAKTQTRSFDPSQASGDSNDGKFINDSSNKDEYSYAFVKNTGFKLYDDERFAGANGVNYVTRFTKGDGTFNLLNGQRAVFSAKFERGSGFKLSQTGFSYAFGDTAKYDGTSANTNTNGMSYNTAATANVPLYKRYKTTYTITDGTGATDLNTDNEKYFADGSYVYKNAYHSTHPSESVHEINGYSTDYNYYGIPLRNIDGSDPTDEGSQITISYTNTVRTGTLILSKKFSEDVKQKLIEQYDPNDPNTNLTFYFTVTFSEVFGGSSGAIPYDGTYKLWDGPSEWDYYIETEKNSSNGYEETYKIAFKLSDILDLSGSPDPEAQDYNSNYGQYRMHKVVIEGIPVYTKYTIEESEPDGQDSGLIFLKANVTKASEPKGKPTSNNTFIAKLEAQIDNDNSPDNDDGFFSSNSLYEEGNEKVYRYHKATDDGISTVSVEAFNADSSAYILLSKTIDWLYYNTHEYPSDSWSLNDYNYYGYYAQSDDPAGLAKRNVTVGGGESTYYDYNGYEDATNAEQSFIYRIEKFERGGDYITPVLVYNEVISFPKESEYDSEKKEYTLSKLLKVDSNYDYRITELTDWSWKYNRTATYVSPTKPFPDATLENSIFNDGKSVWVKTYTVTSYAGHTCNETLENNRNLAHTPWRVYYWKPNDTYSMSGNKSDLDYWAEVIFFNDKVERPKRDVEGDVSIKRNFVKYKGSLSGTNEILAGG